MREQFCAEIKRKLNEGRVFGNLNRSQWNPNPNWIRSSPNRWTTFLEGTDTSHKPPFTFSRPPWWLQKLPYHPQGFLLACFISQLLRKQSKISILRKEQTQVAEKHYETLTLSPKATTDVVVYRNTWRVIRTKRRKDYVFVITHWFIEMTKTALMNCISSAELCRHFVNSWLFNYGLPAERIASNAGCFISKFFIDV